MFYKLFNAIYNTLYCNVNEIVPRIWLGNYIAALDQNFLQNSKIDVVVNCTPNMLFSSLDNIEYIRIPVYDSLLEKDILLMEEYLKVLIPRLSHYYANGKTILIHCYAGKQRSAIVVAALLYYLQNIKHIQILNPRDSRDSQTRHIQLTPQDIFNYILDKRPQAFMYGFRINFFKTFNRFFNIHQT